MAYEQQTYPERRAALRDQHSVHGAKGSAGELRPGNGSTAPCRAEWREPFGKHKHRLPCIGAAPELRLSVRPQNSPPWRLWAVLFSAGKRWNKYSPIPAATIRLRCEHSVFGKRYTDDHGGTGLSDCYQFSE